MCWDRRRTWRATLAADTKAKPRDTQARDVSHKGIDAAAVTRGRTEQARCRPRDDFAVRVDVGGHDDPTACRQRDSLSATSMVTTMG
jgi:hypothetical protein